MSWLPAVLRDVLAGLVADRLRILVVALGVTWGTLGLSLLLATGVAMHAPCHPLPGGRTD